ncbi:MAG: metal-dependent hydrolase [Planctomycetaceae bacterium]|nr:metal-dependent hydrolase [Planctomycetaceae bacterium]
MAAYREHITVSTILGAGYGLGATLALGFTPAQGALAGWFTALGGMLPDLDSETGRPVREMFGLVAAIAPLALVGRVIGWFGLPGDQETVILLIVMMYLAIRYGGAWLVGSLSVHRGMFHSFPAMVIAAEIAYLAYPSQLTTVKLLMACGTAVGFFSHLMLDEMYSVQWAGVRIKLKKSAGSAMKLFGKPFVPNVVTYSILSVLTYAMLVDAGLIEPRDPAVLMQQADEADLGTAESTRTAAAGEGASPFLETTLGEAVPLPNPSEDPAFPAPRRLVDETPRESPPRAASGLVFPPNVDPDAFAPVAR